QPAAILHGGVPGDGNDRLLVAAVTEGRVLVGRRGAGDGVGKLVWLLANLRARRRTTRTLRPVPVVLIPGRLELGDPESLDRHRMLRPLVGLPSLLAVGAAHEKRAAGDGDHLKGSAIVDLFRVVLVVLGLDNRQLGFLGFTAFAQAQ